MVPTDFGNFFLACAGAGGALIGLLFVAVSINPERTFGKAARRERQAVATNAFAAIVNSFFVSTIALLPGKGFGGAALVFAVLGIVNTLGVASRLLAYQIRRYRGSHELPLRIARGMVLVVGSLVLFGFEISAASDLLRHPQSVDDVGTLAILVLASYGLGLTRAWELLGAPRTGLLGWLNPLADLDEPDATLASSSDSRPAAVAAPAAAPAPDPATHAAPRGESARSSRPA